MRLGVSLLGLVLIATLASCGGGGGSTGSSSTTAEKPKGSKAAASSLPRPCEAAELRVLEAPGSVATGHSEAPYAIFNMDHRSCTLRGFPRVVLLGPDGKPVGVPVKPSTNDFFGTVPVRTVVVPIGGIASFRIADTSGPYLGTEKCPKVARMKVTFPFAEGPPHAALSVPPTTAICPDGKPTVSPVARNRRARF